jgi:hypothetical protein
MPLHIQSRSAEILRHLESFVTTACTNPVFRRRLRYLPSEALASAGLVTNSLPDTLPIKHFEISVDLTPQALFGEVTNPDRSVSIPLEIRLVRYGLKPMALCHGPAAHISQLAEASRRLGLTALLSPYEFSPVPDPAAGGYINIAADRRPATRELKGWRGLLVARDSRQIKNGWLSLLFGWDDFLGTLLGYPECCVRSFRANWEAARLHCSGEVGGVLIKQAIRKELPLHSVVAAHYSMNLFARYFGYHLLEHFPCTFECSATRRLGNRLAQSLAVLEPEYFAELQEALAAPVIYAADQGTFLLRGASWEERSNLLNYSSRTLLASNRKSALYRQLMSSDTLSPTGDGISVGGENLEGWLIRFDRADNVRQEL